MGKSASSALYLAPTAFTTTVNPAGRFAVRSNAFDGARDRVVAELPINGVRAANDHVLADDATPRPNVGSLCVGKRWSEDNV